MPHRLNISKLNVFSKPGMLRIPKPRGFTTIQLMVVTALGFGGGVYIWKPLIEGLQQDRAAALLATEAAKSKAATTSEAKN